jgi:hypothetical protein
LKGDEGGPVAATKTKSRKRSAAAEALGRVRRIARDGLTDAEKARLEAQRQAQREAEKAEREAEERAAEEARDRRRSGVAAIYRELGIAGREGGSVRCFAPRGGRHRREATAALEARPCEIGEGGSWYCRVCNAQGGLYDAARLRRQGHEGALELLRRYGFEEEAEAAQVEFDATARFLSEQGKPDAASMLALPGFDPRGSFALRHSVECPRTASGEVLGG